VRGSTGAKARTVGI